MRAVMLLVIALGAAALAQEDENIYVLSDGTKCPAQGTAGSAKGKALNRLKNRSTMPCIQDIDEEVTLAAMLAPGDDDNRFDSDRAATVTGIVVRVIPGGDAESCNCGATNQVDRDTHIELALSPDAPPTQRVIVEVTPRLRKRMKDHSPSVDWSTAALRDPVTGIKGKWVTLTGWLMFDFIHANGAENSNPGDPDNWRATAWEIHPVAAIKMLPGPPAPRTDVAPPTFSAIQRARVRDVNRDPDRKEAVRKKLASYLEGLTDDEKREAVKERTERPRN
jgi:hypothetical protein